MFSHLDSGCDELLQQGASETTFRYFRRQHQTPSLLSLVKEHRGSSYFCWVASRQEAPEMVNEPCITAFLASNTRTCFWNAWCWMHTKHAHSKLTSHPATPQKATSARLPDDLFPSLTSLCLSCLFACASPTAAAPTSCSQHPPSTVWSDERRTLRQIAILKEKVRLQNLRMPRTLRRDSVLKVVWGVSMECLQFWGIKSSVDIQQHSYQERTLTTEVPEKTVKEQIRVQRTQLQLPLSFTWKLWWINLNCWAVSDRDSSGYQWQRGLAESFHERQAATAFI